MKDILNVSQMFSSFQGEGLFTGMPSHFLRLKNCYMNCAFCDTTAIWRKGESLSFVEIQRKLLELGTTTQLVITGGSPLLQADNLANFLSYLGENSYYQYTIEDEGVLDTTVINELAFKKLYYSVSPKLKNSGVPEKKRINWETLLWHAENERSYFKFVVADVKDLIEVNDIISNIGKPMHHKTWLMPLAANIKQYEAIYKEVALLALKNGYNFSTRLHLLLGYE